jgi:hypothetical protein
LTPNDEVASKRPHKVTPVTMNYSFLKKTSKQVHLFYINVVASVVANQASHAQPYSNTDTRKLIFFWCTVLLKHELIAVRGLMNIIKQA